MINKRSSSTRSGRLSALTVVELASLSLVKERKWQTWMVECFRRLLTLNCIIPKDEITQCSEAQLHKELGGGGCWL